MHSSDTAPPYFVEIPEKFGKILTSEDEILFQKAETLDFRKKVVTFYCERDNNDNDDDSDDNDDYDDVYDGDSDVDDDDEADHWTAEFLGHFHAVFTHKGTHFPGRSNTKRLKQAATLIAVVL